MGSDSSLGVTLYAAGDLMNALLLLDSYIAHRSSNPINEPAFPNDISVEVSAFAETLRAEILNPKPYTDIIPTGPLSEPLSLSAAQSPRSKDLGFGLGLRV